MTKSIEVHGRTEEEAIENALVQLGLSRDDVSVEVIETAKTGLFGLKTIPALIRVEYETDEPEEPAEPVYADTQAKQRPEQRTERKIEQKTERKRDSISDASFVELTDDIREKIDTFLTGLFGRMGLDVSFDITGMDGTINVALASDDPGVLIGRRGETLDALQHLTNYAMNRKVNGRIRVHLDAENYRQRRSIALNDLALRTAGKVVKYRRNMTLDPMNAYERHIIHTALQDHTQVTTYSVGSESNRCVVISYGKDGMNTERASSPQYKEWS